MDLGWGLFLTALARSGEVDALRGLLARPPGEAVDNWSSTGDWACQAEAAATAGDRELAARVADRLGARSPRRIAVSGISTSEGPTDGYLALALAASGDLPGATEAADRAEVLAQEWGLAAYLRWLGAWRGRLGF